MGTVSLRVARILEEGARGAHVLSEPAAPSFVPIDRRCPGCGIDRPSCPTAFCSRRHEDES